MSLAGIGFVAYAGLAAANFQGGLNSKNRASEDDLKFSLTTTSLLAIVSTISYIAYAVLIDSLSYQAYSIGHLCGLVSVGSGILTLFCMLAAINVTGHLFGATLRETQCLKETATIQRDEIALSKLETALIQFVQGPFDRAKFEKLESLIRATLRQPSRFPNNLQQRITNIFNQIELIGLQHK